MVLTNERAEVFAKYLTDDKDRANALLELTPEEAAERINADGFDFTAEEVKEFGENLKAAVAQQDGELDEISLDDVSGGLATAAAAVYLTCVTIGIGLGTAAAGKWKW